MPQDIQGIKDHARLFQDPEYQALLQCKQTFEDRPPLEEVARVAEWTKSWEYREKNFQREALTINPAKACQPLGAIFAAAGFEGTLPFVHGSQGCVAYFRTHLTRHFKEPFSAVSTSMTEDAAVFGGLKNLIEGLENAYTLYKPKMIAVCTTCMAEVIGDDLGAFITTARNEGAIPRDFPVPYAHTPSFVGSHITGYDNMLKAILSTLTEPVGRTGSNGHINVIPGFDTYMGNLREIKRIFGLFGIPLTLLADNSDYLDSPNDGTFRMYPGGTPLEVAAQCLNAEATFSFQRYTTPKTLEFLAEASGRPTLTARPVGIRGTDEFLMQLSRLTGRPIPPELEIERGRAVDAFTDSQAWIHGKRVALFGDPDLAMGLLSLLLELGAEPVHVVVTNSNEEFETEARALLASSPYGQGATVWGGKDLWHLRSLMFTEPVDLLIGNSYGKYLWRDTGTPLVRIGYPIFDRHHLHRYPTYGYVGALNLLNWLVNTLLDEADRRSITPSKTDFSFDLIR